MTSFKERLRPARPLHTAREGGRGLRDQQHEFKTFAGQVDFKIVSPRVCSFLNVKGGILYIGIADDGTGAGQAHEP